MSEKKTTLEALEEFLQKARRRLSDENADYSDMDESPDRPAEFEPAYGDYENSESGDDEDEDTERPDFEDEDDEAGRLIRELEGRPTKPAAAKKKSKVEQSSEEAPKRAAAPTGPVKRKATVPPSAATPPAPPPAVPPVEQPVAAPQKTESRPVPEQTQVSSSDLSKLPAHLRQYANAPSGPSKRFTVRPGEVTEQRDDPNQPTRDELMALREYTRPFERRLRDRERLEAQPHMNPIKYHQGVLLEARAKAHGDRDAAYREFISRPEYQNATRMQRMRMDTQFDKDWRAKNPDHTLNAILAHGEAHKRGSEAMGAFLANKEEKIRHIAGGGVQPGAFSYDEGMQHAGGSRGGDDDEGPQGGIVQDKAAQFAANADPEFLANFLKNRKQHSPGSLKDMSDYTERTSDEIANILGNPEALKDPKKKAAFDRFFAKHAPLIEKARNHVISKLGLQGRHDIDAEGLNYIGMHGLVQAVNDYNHDHASGAKFTTHAGTKIRGLMQTALRRHLEDVPQEMRAADKKFKQQKAVSNASPVRQWDKTRGDINDPNAWITKMPENAAPPAPAAPEPVAPPAPAPVKAAGPTVVKRSAQLISKHPPEVQDRLKRVTAAKAPLQRKWNVNVTNGSSEGEEE